MKLKSLKKVIHTDLTLYDCNAHELYTNVDVYSEMFKKFENYDVASIRGCESCTHIDKGIIISIR